MFLLLWDVWILPALLTAEKSLRRGVRGEVPAIAVSAPIAMQAAGAVVGAGANDFFGFGARSIAILRFAGAHAARLLPLFRRFDAVGVFACESIAQIGDACFQLRFERVSLPLLCGALSAAHRALSVLSETAHRYTCGCLICCIG